MFDYRRESLGIQLAATTIADPNMEYHRWLARRLEGAWYVWNPIDYPD